MGISVLIDILLPLAFGELVLFFIDKENQHHFLIHIDF